MAPAAKPTWRMMLRQIHADLAWFPGRRATTWRMAALCSLMAMVAMLYGIPEAAISCYLILFVMKPDPVTSIVIALAVSILVSIVASLIILILPWTLEHPLLRMTVLVVSSFTFLWLSSASKLRAVGSIIALAIAFAMSLSGAAPNGELATRAVLYAWLMAVTPMALLAVFNLFFGGASWKWLRMTLTKRLITAANALRHPNDSNIAAVRAQLLEGQAELLQRVALIRLFRLCPTADIAWFEAAINHSYHLLLAIAGQDKSAQRTNHPDLAEWCENAARAVSGKRAIAPPGGPQHSSCEIREALAALAMGVHCHIPPPSRASFFVDDAFTNPIHQHFALKTTAASLICYLIYTTLDWQDIHTAMVTCYVAALGTTGETIHKLALRLLGCLTGALIGALSLLFVVPAMTDIGQLMGLIFVVILPVAWVAAGNERIAYAGIQAGLAFLLTVLQGFGPPGQLDVAFDRIIGILLGNLVVYVLFTRLWPTAIADSVRAHIHKALSGLATLAALPSGERATALREAASIEAALFCAFEAIKLLPFEPLSLRPSALETVKMKAILAEIARVCPLLYVADNTTHPHAERLRRLAAGRSSQAESHIQALAAAKGAIHDSISRLEELMQ
ncbi:FUSC family protein [Klebsiella pneumoniae]|uniref:FUSC family protein n=1 Tax=Klebsiella pneumoniae TaxID=573 RepID=UPI000BA3AD69|nr:FUSC family protein [Klebsiella pneumoniae]EJN1491914.1 FUSC family protein [Klebsiella pneumoniae]EKU0228614.1 FUSC family protein [Klebsiella pneumoniae]EKZ6364083.1 FUSC family protein [Klebsiella pneumoniae]EKZ6443352.1 FUSC family protein [Klebsiella pneumoniae]MBM1126189.1 FUSC family protein [Klebsiella pneumoniae]